MACQFHDFKKLGVPADALVAWVQAAGWARVVNRQGTAWRQLSDADKTVLAEPTPEALVLPAQHASVIKRPVVRWPDGRITVGMDEAMFEAHAV